MEKQEVVLQAIIKLGLLAVVVVASVMLSSCSAGKTACKGGNVWYCGYERPQTASRVMFNF